MDAELAETAHVREGCEERRPANRAQARVLEVDALEQRGAGERRDECAPGVPRRDCDYRRAVDLDAQSRQSPEPRERGRKLPQAAAPNELWVPAVAEVILQHELLELRRVGESGGERGSARI